MNFEQNVGQANPQVRFFSRGSGYSVFLTDAGATFVNGNGRSSSAFSFDFVNAAHTLVKGEDPLQGTTNYIHGRDASNWHTNVPLFAKVKYSSIYRGIDAVFYGNQRQLEYDFVVAPRANARDIRLRITGEAKVSINKAGDLLISSPSGEASFERPLAYQQIAGERRSIVADYQLSGNEISLVLGDYDHSQALIIDPKFVWGSYLGGSNNDEAIAITVDSARNVYVTGATESYDFPITSGAFSSTNHGGGDCFRESCDNFRPQEIFVTKISADGTRLIYSTYVGGNGEESPGGIAVDSSGNAFVAGYTRAWHFDCCPEPVEDVNTFPVTSGAYNSGPVTGGAAFVFKLNAAGNALVYSTFLGGDFDGASAISINSLGEAFVAGIAQSNAFPTTPGAYKQSKVTDSDGFVTHLNASGSALIYSTFLGSTARVLALDSANNAYVAGGSRILRLNSTGSAVTYTYSLSGTSVFPEAITVDSAGNSYTVGSAGYGLHTTRNAYQLTLAPSTTIYPANAFLVKLNPSGSAQYSSYFGGNYFDLAGGVAVDTYGRAYLVGVTGSTDLPQTADAITSASKSTLFLTRIDTNRSGEHSLSSSTFVGGNAMFDGLGLALDSARNAYVTATIIDYSGVTPFPTTAGSFQPHNNSQPDPFNGDALYWEAAIAKIAYPSPSCSTPSSNGVNMCNPANGSTLASPFMIRAAGRSSAAIARMDLFIDGLQYDSFQSPKFDRSVALANGAHTIRVIGTDTSGVKVSATKTVTVTGSKICAVPSASNVNICSPGNGSAIPSPANIQSAARTSRQVVKMELWIDGVKQATSSSFRMNFSAYLPNGSHQIGVVGTDAAGAKVGRNIMVNINGGVNVPQ